MPKLTEVGPVSEQFVHEPFVDQFPLANVAILGDPGFRGNAIQAQLLHEFGARAQLNEPREDMPDHFGFTFVGDKPAIFDVITKRRDTTHPHAFSFGGGDFVANALASDLSLKLSERQQNVQHQSTHRSGGIELLSD